MHKFSEIIGHEQIRDHLEKAVKGGKPFHAYIFQGDVGVGKEHMVKTFAAALQCQSDEEKPCGQCPSCIQFESGNQPDVIWVQHEKVDYYSVDEIRQQICNTMDIKPFSSPYKIYIVQEAEKMNEAAQNALLKTLEEPPKYGVVILLTSNVSALLPTIQSRCLTLEFRPLSNSIVEQYLRDHESVPDYLAKTSAAFAQGNIGKAVRYAKSNDFTGRKDSILNLLHHVMTMDIPDMLDVIEDLGTRRDEVRDYIDLMQLWYRDVLIFKATKNINQLIFQSDSGNIMKEAEGRSYESLERIMDAFEKAKTRLKANVNFEITMELMFLSMKDE
ncbi:MAG: DNA polymerase III subunit delta' [Eubacterium sp.]|nr:DNA polymerase III subunit delta' [Eubacterium sp.]